MINKNTTQTMAPDLQIQITIKSLTRKEFQKLIKQWAVARDVYNDLLRLFGNPREDCDRIMWWRSYHQQRGLYRSRLSKILNQPII